MPVNTSSSQTCILKAGSEIMMNTYHLMIRLELKRISRIGGLHEFMNCDLPILKSEVSEVMSLSKLNKVDREKILVFNSHVDGKIFLSQRKVLKFN